MTANEGTVASFELSASPDATLIATVRRFVGALCARVLADEDVTSRVVVATHELLDNAARYASSGVAHIRVELRRAGDDVEVLIVTENRAAEEHGRDLGRLLEEMRGSDDRDAFYQDLLCRAAARTEGSGLGLGRVHAESELVLSGGFEDEIARIRAEGRFRSRGPAPR